jgi:hypothetical protein
VMATDQEHRTYMEHISKQKKKKKRASGSPSEQGFQVRCIKRFAACPSNTHITMIPSVFGRMIQYAVYFFYFFLKLESSFH